MRRTALSIALILTGCSEPGMQAKRVSEDLAVHDVAAPPPGEVAQRAPGIVATPEGNTPAAPQIAYAYTVGYRLADGAVAATQAKHSAQCAALGSARCLIVSTRISSSDDPAGYTRGSAVFLVDARLARTFIARLDATAAGAGGTATDRTVEADDVTKQIIDVDARVRAKQALADRLVGLIKSTNAKVGDLVAAEQAYAEAQEALDAARSNQAELRRRVAMSRVSVDYSSTAATGAWGPVAQSFAAIGTTLATSIAALVTFVVAALPWALLLAVLIWVGRRRGWRLRWPWRRREGDPPPV